MNKMKAAAAAASALMMFGSSAAYTAFAEYAEQYAETVCPGYAPTGADVLAVTGPANSEYTVQVYQHSPERANLLLFDQKVAPAENPVWYYKLEPGDYTVNISVPLASDGHKGPVVSQKFTIANPDYVTDAETFTHSEYSIQVSLKTTGGAADITPQVTADAVTVKDSVCSMNINAGFFRYTLATGDFDGKDGVSISDAQSVLQEYVTSRANPNRTDGANAEQKAVCDIDEDGALTVSDAQMILRYYVLKNAKNNPTWDQIRNGENA